MIDGMNLVYRAFYGMPELTRASDGFPTNALYGWMKMLWKLEDQFPMASREVFWDAGADERTELAADYKAQRAPAPEPMTRQLPIIEELTSLMGIPSWKEEGMEADDLLSSRALHLSDAGEEVVIVSADKDFAQLVNARITILNPPPTANPRADWRRLDAAGVVEKFGVTPDQIVDYLSLIGDASDNIAGIDGVGPKTAVAWLKSYHNIEGIVANCGKLSPKRFQNIIYTSGELLERNRKMIVLARRDMPTQSRTEAALNPDALVARLTEFEMKSTAVEAAKRYGVAV